MRPFFLLLSLVFLIATPALANIWTIAIDPGHGGKDPGAIGRNLKIYEKHVTLSIARELKVLLDKDPNFRAVLTRKGDYYISVPERSEIARKNKANYLISIHADSLNDPDHRGASVWVLSNRRANDEMGQWLEDDEKRSELLGGAGSILTRNTEKYLNQTVLDLQFGHSQRVGYELGYTILRNFSQITRLSRSTPQHASLGVLRSPDIPSVLVETGFLSNSEEEAKLSTASYRRRVAYMIYQGLVDYRRRNVNADINTIVKATPSYTTSEPQVMDSGLRHKVKSGETLDILAKKYGVKVADIMILNKLTQPNLRISDSIKIPNNGKSAVKINDKNPAQVTDSGIRHKVKSGESLDSLAKKYGIKIAEIMELNELKRKDLRIGEILKIPGQAKNNDKSEQKQKDAISQLLDKQEKKNNKKAENNKNKTEKVSDTPKYHIIQQDQTIYAVGRLYGISPDKILKLNPKLKDGKVFAGQKIQIRE